MREILGRRSRLLSRLTGRKSDRSPSLKGAALTFATAWKWPVVPGVGLDRRDGTRCACPDPDCTVPGAHPLDPGLLTATTDERMVSWWWTNRPDAPIVLATGVGAPCAVSLPVIAESARLPRSTRWASGSARSWRPPPAFFCS